MITVFTILIVLAAIILVLVVLVQKSKGGGLSSNFASSNSIMGVHKTTDFVEKITWGLAGFIMVLSIACVMMRPDGRQSGYKSQVEVEKTVPATPNLNTNSVPGQQQEAPASQPVPGAPSK